jgi:DNA polymerase III delta prime subunit
MLDRRSDLPWSSKMAWQARARSGDASAALLQPHQVLVSHADAAPHSVRQLDLVRVRFLSSRSVLLLECVIDRPPPSTEALAASGTLDGGRIQLHPWVLDVCGQLEGAPATLEKVSPVTTTTSWRLALSLQTKFPPVATSGSDDAGLDLGDSRIDLLPESVRQRQIDLEAVVGRQMRAAGTLRAPQEGQLVPVKLLGDTYVFRIGEVKESEALLTKPAIIVKGWSETSAVEDEAELTQQVATLSIQEQEPRRMPGSSYESELNDRLWQDGFAGYTAFVQDALLNLALVLKSGPQRLENGAEMEQIGSHGVLISGVSGVGKSLALAVLQRELVREEIATWRVDGTSLLMGAEGPAFPTAYEYLTHELERRFPDLGPLGSLQAEQASSSCVGVVLIDDVDVLFQSADGQIAEGSDAQLPQLGSALLRLLDELNLRNARLVVVGTTASADANVPLAAKRTGRFGKVLDLVVPTEQARREILRRHLVGLPLRSEELRVEEAGSLASRIAALTGGYVAKDLVRICRNAAAQAHTDATSDCGPAKPLVGWTELLRAQQQVKPSQLREFNVASPGASADGSLAFAGYAAVQKQLVDFVSWKFHPTAAMNVRRLLCSDTPSYCRPLTALLAALGHLQRVGDLASRSVGLRQDTPGAGAGSSSASELRVCEGKPSARCSTSCCSSASLTATVACSRLSCSLSTSATARRACANSSVRNTRSIALLGNDKRLMSLACSSSTRGGALHPVLR